MKQEFKINFKDQAHSIKQCIYMLVPIILAVIFFEIQNQELNSEAAFFTLIIFGILFLGMALPFHIQYLFTNWNTRLVIDFNSKKIQIIQGNKTSVFNISEIVTERIIGHQDSYKNPLKYYGFVRIKTKQNEMFIISSLMANPFKFPLKIDSTKYCLPYIKKNYSAAELEILTLEEKEAKERRINIFTNSFENLSTKELIYKIENKKEFQIEAITAAERIIKERTNNSIDKKIDF